MICTNPNCEKYNKKTNVVEYVRGGDTTYYCIWCKETIDETIQPSDSDSKGPYIKRKKWLSEWKHINTGRTSDDVKLKPKFNE